MTLDGTAARGPVRAALTLLVAGWTTSSPMAAAGLEDDLGRNEVRVYASPARLETGLTVTGAGLPERLDRLGYQRVHRRPEAPGEYFWGHQRFWIYRRPHRSLGRGSAARLIGLQLNREDGRILGFVDPAPPAGDRRIEGELLSESLDGGRAPRLLLRLDELPAHVWRTVLAAEDARFFEHSGVDARALARAMLENALAGRVVQGGSTISQQLVKMRDLTPRRTLGRKVSEAVRALALEADHDKREILEAYLNAVYMGHLEGLAIHGLGSAAAAYFSKSAGQLDLAESAALAALIQGPNRLHPVRHPRRLEERQRWVLSRMEELGWASNDDVALARHRGLRGLATSPPRPPIATHFLDWVRGVVEEREPDRMAEGRGVVVVTTLDAPLQQVAEEALESGLASLRRAAPGLRGRGLTAALVALDGPTGNVVAYVGGDPARRDEFDRARRARRQPGSTVKPLVALEAFDSCGRRSPVYPSRRVLDGPVVVALPSGEWSPVNPDGRFRGPVSVRRAVVESLNTPLVRLARWCGFGPTADRLRRAGLRIPDPAPPSFVLGAVEASPLELAAAYSLFAASGKRSDPRPVERLETASGRRLGRSRVGARRVARAGAAYLVQDVLQEAVRAGTARGGGMPVEDLWGKTGTSSGGRDAWFVGGVGRLVTVVWIGSDRAEPLGLTGGRHAAPIWRDFMRQAAAARPAPPPSVPRSIREGWIDQSTGLRVGGPGPGVRSEPFLRGAPPPRGRADDTRTPPPID